MKIANYAYAVGRIRENENKLLSNSDIIQLVNAPDFASAIHLLQDNGWSDLEQLTDDNIEAAFLKKAEQTWQLLSEIAPDVNVHDFLVLNNDFHNLKTALKSYVTHNPITTSYLTPSVANVNEVIDAVNNKRFDLLPEFLKEAATEAYDVLTRTYDGQAVDVIIDRAALEAIYDAAKATNNEFITDVASIICDVANIKIALRAMQTQKDKKFLDAALCNSGSLNKSELADAAAQGRDSLLSYLNLTDYSMSTEHFAVSITAFEKWCDDLLMMRVQQAKYISIGVEPLIAYFIARQAEIKNVRIILLCKLNNIAADEIMERVRKTYV